jgi:hypothetical protein
MGVVRGEVPDWATRSGYGYGAGDGYGAGYGSGDGYWRSVLARHTAPAGAQLGLWWSDASGKPCNGGSGTAPAAVGVVHESSGPLELCGRGVLRATLKPEQWKGERIWIVALHGEVVGDDEKLGCLKREIIAEVSAGKGAMEREDSTP